MPDVDVDLAAVRAMPLREERIHAATALIEQVEADADAVRRFRDDEVRALIRQFGPSEAARRSGLSLSTVKLIKGRP